MANTITEENIARIKKVFDLVHDGTIEVCTLNPIAVIGLDGVIHVRIINNPTKVSDTLVSLRADFIGCGKMPTMPKVERVATWSNALSHINTYINGYRTVTQ